MFSHQKIYSAACRHCYKVTKKNQENTFKRKNQVITLDRKGSAKVDDTAVRRDPQLLYQRLVVVAKAIVDIESVFKYVLCSYPPALFDNHLLLRESQKPVLANTIWALMNTSSIPEIQGRVQYVLHGGVFLHRIPWIHGSTYKNVCTLYTDCVRTKYGNAIVIFDGYEGISTKYMTHQRRAK